MHQHDDAGQLNRAFTSGPASDAGAVAAVLTLSSLSTGLCIASSSALQIGGFGGT